MEFGEIIRSRRRDLEMTQSEVAEIVGVDQQTITRIEKHHVEPKFTLGFALCEALQLVPSQVYEEMG